MSAAVNSADDRKSSNAVAQRGVTDTIASVSDAGDAACWLGRYTSQTAMAGTAADCESGNRDPAPLSDTVV
jgi:hypothetical protein